MAETFIELRRSLDPAGTFSTTTFSPSSTSPVSELRYRGARAEVFGGANVRREFGRKGRMTSLASMFGWLV